MQSFDDWKIRDRAYAQEMFMYKKNCGNPNFKWHTEYHVCCATCGSEQDNMRMKQMYDYLWEHKGHEGEIFLREIALPRIIEHS